MSDLNSMTVVELKQQLKEHGLPVSGVKSDLISRLELEEDRIRILESIPPEDLEKMDVSKEVVGEFLYTSRHNPLSVTDVLVFSFMWLLAYGLLNAGLKWLDKEGTDIGGIFFAIWLGAALVYSWKVSLKRVRGWKNDKKFGNAPIGQIFTTRNRFTPMYSQGWVPSGMESMQLAYWSQFEGMVLKLYCYEVKTEKGLYPYLYLKHGKEYFGPNADLLYWEEE